MGFYKTAQICLNGHVITSDTDNEAWTEKFCSKCGAETIVACSHCHASIRGDYVHCEPYVSMMSKPPFYCHNCGKPFPWIESALAAANELIDDTSKLDAEEKFLFKASLPEILSDNPRTTLAATRIAKYLQKFAPTAQETFKQIFYRLAADVAKVLVWGE